MQQIARYGTVGVSNTLISAAAYAALVVAGVAAVAAAAIAFALGAVNGFAWNRRWTFASAQRASLARYVLVQGAGLAATSLIVRALDVPVGRFGAYAVAAVAVTLSTYTANRRWTFG